MDKSGIHTTVALAKEMAIRQGWDESSDHVQARPVEVKDLVGGLMNTSQDFSVELEGTTWTDSRLEYRPFRLLASPPTGLFEYEVEGQDPRSNVDHLPTPWSTSPSNPISNGTSYIPRWDPRSPPALAFYQELQIWGDIKNSLFDRHFSDKPLPVECWYLPIGFAVIHCEAPYGGNEIDMIFDHRGRHMVFYQHSVEGNVTLEMTVVRATRKQTPQSNPLIKTYVT